MSIGSFRPAAAQLAFKGGSGPDEYTLVPKTSEAVRMGGGDDTVTAASKGLDAGDRIDGGAGADTLELTGKLPDTFTFGKATLTGFEFIGIHGQGAFDLVLDRHMVSRGTQLFVYSGGFFGEDVTQVRIDGSDIKHGTLRLIGSYGDDVLIGGKGADLIGGDATGNDTLTGNGGADQFVFTSIVPQHAVITDFARGTDVIYTQDFAFDELTITDSADGAVVEIYDGVFATVKGIAASQLTAADFIFAGHDTIGPDAVSAATGHLPVIHDLPLA